MTIAVIYLWHYQYIYAVKTDSWQTLLSKCHSCYRFVHAILLWFLLCIIKWSRFKENKVLLILLHFLTRSWPSLHTIWAITFTLAVPPYCIFDIKQVTPECTFKQPQYDASTLQVQVQISATKYIKTCCKPGAKYVPVPFHRACLLGRVKEMQCESETCLVEVDSRALEVLCSCNFHLALAKIKSNIHVRKMSQ